jgi:hypothetical protein
MNKTRTELCKHAIVYGGDLVPYGNDNVPLPYEIECDNPIVSDDELDYIECGKTCPYYELK